MQLGMTVEERVSDEFKRTVLKAGEYSLNQLQAKFESEWTGFTCTYRKRFA